MPVSDIERIMQEIHEKLDRLERRGGASSDQPNARRPFFSFLSLSGSTAPVSSSDPTPSLRVRDLLDYPDEEFVRNAYRKLLYREPDPAGYEHYIKALRHGKKSRIEVLGRIRYSREGKAKKARIRGLPLSLALEMASKIPVLGYFFRLVTAIFSLPSLVRSKVEFEDEFRGSPEMIKHDLTPAIPLRTNAAAPRWTKPSLPMSPESRHRPVSIIILTWNGLSYTKRCLDSLRHNTAFPQLEIVVVDNGSADGTIEYLRSLDNVRVILNEKNEGFSKGNNMAIRSTDSTDIVLLNNDIVITQPDWLVRLQHAAYSSHDIGIVGCRLVHKNGMLLHAGTFIYPETYWGQQIGGGQADVNQYSFTREVEGVVFAATYIKRELLDRLGLLDERFFSYFEDTDYCLRAKSLGYRTVCVGDVTLLHHENTSTRVNRASLMKVFTKSQSAFREKWDACLKAKYSRVLGWQSVAHLPTGYAMSSRNLMSALDQKGVDIRYRYVYGQGTPFPLEEPLELDDYKVSMFRMREFPKDCPHVVYGQADVFSRNSGKYRIGFTMLEVTGIPREWVEHCNRMHEVWTPSSFNARTFCESGVTVPIHVVPLGVDPDFFNPSVRSFRTRDEYAFLSVFEWGERKCPDKLIRAFATEFTEDEDVLLICRVINNDGAVNVPDQISRMNLPKNHGRIVLLFNQRISNHPDVQFVYSPNIPYYQMGALYKSADCFVLPTRGEGWGMPVMEAMACGLPVIVTDWGAHMDFVNGDNAYLLATKGLIDARAKCPYYSGFQWADPDEEHLRHLMREVYEHPYEAGHKGMSASGEVLRRWTWEDAAEVILKRLNDIG